MPPGANLHAMPTSKKTVCMSLGPFDDVKRVKCWRFARVDKACSVHDVGVGQGGEKMALVIVLHDILRRHSTFGYILCLSPSVWRQSGLL